MLLDGDRMSREARKLKEMAGALVKHVELLREYAVKCFAEAKSEYGGEVAGKLRLLVARFRSNRPLLLDLMNEVDSGIRITLDGPPIRRPPGEPGPGDRITLEEYLDLGAVGTRIPNGGFVMLTRIQLIRAWAEQTGASHEDWTIDPALRQALDAPVYIMGVQGTIQELRITTNTVLHVSDRFIDELKTKGILDA